MTVTGRELIQKVIDILPGKWTRSAYHKWSYDTHCAVGLIDLAANMLGLGGQVPLADSDGDIAMRAVGYLHVVEPLNKALRSRGFGYDLDDISVYGPPSAEAVLDEVIRFNDFTYRSEDEVLDFFKDVYAELPLEDVNVVTS